MSTSSGHDSSGQGAARPPLPPCLPREDYAHRYGERRQPSPREFWREQTLADWLGPERKNEVFAAMRPEKAGMPALVDQVLERFVTGEVEFLERLRNSWKGLFGAAVAAHSSPVDLKDGVLYVEVSSASWLYAFEREEKSRIRAVLLQHSKGSINDLRFVQRGRFIR